MGEEPNKLETQTLPPRFGRRRLLLLGFETVGFSAACKGKEATYVLKEGENYAACSLLALDLGHLFHSLKGDWGKELQAFSGVGRWETGSGLRFLLAGPPGSP